MLDLADKRDLVEEINSLIKTINNSEKNIDLYCELMVQMFMKQSTNN